MVLGLWGALFKLIEITFFLDLFSENWFIATASFSTIAGGIAIARRWEPAILTVRGVVLVLLRLLWGSNPIRL